MADPVSVRSAPTFAVAAAVTACRRCLLLLLPLLALLPWVLYAAPALMLTPEQMLGPYYPLQPDVQAGSDLATVDGKGRAHGTPLIIVGRVIDGAGRPQAGVLLEIWQTNAHGRYHHPHDHSPPPLDPQFRGYGRVTTGADGAYRFVTIQPAAYPGRTPHVHFRISRGELELLVTQMYLPAAGAANARDGLFMSVREPAARRLLVGVPEPGAEDKLRFDIVLQAGR